MTTKSIKAAQAAIAGLRNTAVEATATAAGAYRDYADTLAVLFGEDWYLLEGMRHRDDEEKARLADLRKERAEFKAVCKARGIGDRQAWRNVRKAHMPETSEPNDTTPRDLAVYTVETIPPALRRAARDDSLETPDHVADFWKDVEAAYIKHFPNATRDSIYGEAND
jgi:hypothetical protein